jgi:hypothetical protein
MRGKGLGDGAADTAAAAGDYRNFPDSFDIGLSPPDLLESVDEFCPQFNPYPLIPRQGNPARSTLVLSPLVPLSRG